jgi:hypothetical protein
MNLSLRAAAIAATAFVITAPALAANATWNAKAEWIVGERSGSVTVQHNGVGEIAMREAVVEAGDVVTTGATGTAVLMRGEEFVILAPNSRVRIADASESDAMVQVVAEAGNTVYRLKRKTLQDFAVKTPVFSAIAHGTTFNVSVSPERATIQSVEGPVEVTTTSGTRELVKPGMVAIVSVADQSRIRIARTAPLSVTAAATAPVAPTMTASLFQR